MPEFRQNIATKEWVIIATERAKRPKDFLKSAKEKAQLPEHDPRCPFCPGNEDQTPPPVLTFDTNGHWQVRVVPNKFAALQPHESTERSRCGRFTRSGGYGVAEVIIEHPAHHLTLATMEPQAVQEVVRAYKSRYAAIASMPNINLITIFRNHGLLAGTSLVHPHSQIIASPIVPPHVRDPIHQAALSYDTFGSCVYCDIIREETKQGDRILVNSEHFVAFCPFASRSPFEIRILPKKHNAGFGDIEDEKIPGLTHVLQDCLQRLHIGLSDPDYNFVIRSAPVGDENVRHLHWYLVIIPKLSTPAGFEIGSGIYINSSLPEQCAEFLRSVQL